MRSLRALDNELVKHDLLFGRGMEKRTLCQLLADSKDGVLLAGLGGMGKTTLMLHVLRDLGGVRSRIGSSQHTCSESGHSLYFEDLESFVQFLRVRGKPVRRCAATIVVKWDADGAREERCFQLSMEHNGDERSNVTTIHGASTLMQMDRTLVEVHLEANIEQRFDDAQVTKLASSSLVRFSEGLARAVCDAKRAPEMLDDEQRPRRGMIEDEWGHIPTLLVDHLRGSDATSDRRYAMLLNLLDERVGSLVEDINKHVYMSASTYLRSEDKLRRRISLHEFEEELTVFLESINLDRLIPGDSTFWRWYIGIDHLERGSFGWTLDTKREAVRVLYEKIMGMDGFRLMTAIENNPRSLFRHVEDGAGTASFVQGGRKIRMLSLGMPDQTEFVQEASSLITDKVEELEGLSPSVVGRSIAQLYERCSGRMRLYFLVRSIKNLPSIAQRGVDDISPDTSFLDRQISEALLHLGILYEYDRSMENIPAVQPLIVLAHIMKDDRSPSSRRGISRRVMAWLLETFENVHTMEIEQYLEAMELYGVLSGNGDRVEFFDPVIEREFDGLSEKRAIIMLPLIRTFQSRSRLREFLSSMTVEDLSDISGYAETFFTNTSQTFRPDNGPYELMLAELDADDGRKKWKEKISILLSLAVLGKVPFSPSQKKEQSTRTAKLISEMSDSVNDSKLSSNFSRALLLLMQEGSSRACVSCGQLLEEGHFFCPVCHTDHRPVCGGCGARNSPIFMFCTNCGLKLK